MTVESWVLIISIAYPYIQTVSAAISRMNGCEIGFARLRQPMIVRAADTVPDINMRTTSRVNWMIMGPSSAGDSSGSV